MENEIERRSSKRFEVKLPSTLIYPTGENKGVEYHFLLSRDISSNGAYFNTVKPITYDGPVQIEILIEVSKESNHYVYMTTSGKIVRSSETGLAVSFAEDFSLSPFPTH